MGPALVDERSVLEGRPAGRGAGVEPAVDGDDIADRQRAVAAAAVVHRPRVGRPERRILTDVEQLEHSTSRSSPSSSSAFIGGELVDGQHVLPPTVPTRCGPSREGDRATAIVTIAALMQVLDQLDGGAVPAAVGLVVRRRACLGLDVQSPSSFSSLARYFSRADARCRSHAVLPHAVLR